MFQQNLIRLLNLLEDLHQMRLLRQHGLFPALLDFLIIRDVLLLGFHT